MTFLKTKINVYCKNNSKFDISTIFHNLKLKTYKPLFYIDWQLNFHFQFYRLKFRFSVRFTNELRVAPFSVHFINVKKNKAVCLNI